MNDVAKETRRMELHQAWTDEIRKMQGAMGHESPIPAFLNLVTDRVIDIQIRLEDLEGREVRG